MACILMGPPGSGKGTQAKLLSSELEIPHISTGDILRSEIASGSELGNRVKAVVDSGKYVDDELMIELIDQRLSLDDAKAGFILDGFPRTENQAHALDRLFEAKKYKQLKVIEMQVRQELLMERLTGRLSCPSCGAAFHKSLNKPKVAGICDNCGTALVTREDDLAETVKKRLQVFETQTRPLLAFYRDGNRLYTVDGSLAVDEIKTEIKRLLLAS
ncbi:MAG: adenylate kinase [Deltaproteobacteria bacterium CG11_big_fil_rev_8_21_14_0_20_45_16]|nr:MAG: adenylate kinase [Deltaproteobacteria bacterium CG11_big_fil_rev_8_21_14_0_20_45_16]